MKTVVLRRDSRYTGTHVVYNDKTHTSIRQLRNHYCYRFQLKIEKCSVVTRTRGNCAHETIMVYGFSGMTAAACHVEWMVAYWLCIFILWGILPKAAVANTAWCRSEQRRIEDANNAIWQTDSIRNHLSLLREIIKFVKLHEQIYREFGYSPW